MAVNAGSQRRLSIIRESVFGTTPGSPAMLGMRWATHTLEFTKAGLQSPEIRGDRQIRYFRHGMRRVTGGIAGPLMYGDLDILFEAALCGAWTNEAAGTPNTLKAGVTKYSHSIEDGALDLTTPAYQLYNGMVCTGFTLRAAPGGLATAEFAWMGRDMVPSTTSVDSSPAAVTDNEPMNTLTGTISEGGSPIAEVTGIDITLDNGVEACEAMGDDKMFDFILGDSNVTGNLVCYFKDLTMINKFVNETSSSLEMVLAGIPANKTLTFKIGNLKYTRAQAGVSGPRGLPITMPFQGLYNGSDLSNIVITRSNPA